MWFAFTWKSDQLNIVSKEIFMNISHINNMVIVKTKFTNINGYTGRMVTLVQWLHW